MPVDHISVPESWEDGYRVVLFRLHRPHQLRLYVATIHLQHDKRRAEQLPDNVTTHLDNLSHDFAIIGDFNAQLKELPLCPFLASGILFAADSELR